MKTIILAAAAITLAACAGTPPLSSTLTDADLDRLKAAHWYAYRGTLSKQAVWANAKTGMGGIVRALAEFPDPATGRPCRRVVEDTRSVDGRRDIRIGTACQQPSGDLIVEYSERASTDGEE